MKVPGLAKRFILQGMSDKNVIPNGDGIDDTPPGFFMNSAIILTCHCESSQGGTRQSPAECGVLKTVD